MVGEGELTHVVFFRSLLTGSLTERPHRGFSVGLEALDETDAVLLSCGFHGADVEHFVVEADIFKVFDVLILIFDPKVAGVFCLSRCHVDVGMLDLVVSRESPEAKELAKRQSGELALIRAAADHDPSPPWRIANVPMLLTIPAA